MYKLAILFFMCILSSFCYAQTPHDLAQQGTQILEERLQESPLLFQIYQQYQSSKPLKGTNIVVNGWGRSEALLCYLLSHLGANVHGAGFIPFPDYEAIEAALAQKGVVFKISSTNKPDPALLREMALGNKNWTPNFLFDFSGILSELLEKEDPKVLDHITGIIASSPESTQVFQDWEKQKVSFPPVVSVLLGDVHSKIYAPAYLRVSTYAVLSQLPIIMAGKKAVVCGYGRVGRVVANVLQETGAQVSVTEIDPLRAAEALMKGINVSTLPQLIPNADLVVTATGAKTLQLNDLLAMKQGAILYNMGFYRTALPEELFSYPSKERSPGFKNIQLPNGNSIVLVTDGYQPNRTLLSFKKEIADLRWANMLLLALDLLQHPEKYPRNHVYAPPPAIEKALLRDLVTRLGGELTTASD